MDEVERKYWIGFSRISRVGRARITQLEQHFGRLEHAWRATAGELKSAGLDSGAISACVTARDEIDLDAELETLGRHGISAFTWHDADYPKQLLEVYDRPPVLYVR